jgi:glycosyltransferase involved in cell wall biosynthesis
VKIAVFHNLPSGGAKRALYNYVTHLKNGGHQIDVHVPSTANETYMPLKDVVDGFHTYPVRQTVRGVLGSQYFLQRSFVDLERTEDHIASEINAGPYDLVLSEQDQSTITPYLLRQLKKPTVYYCQQPCRVEEAVLREVVRAAFPAPPMPLPVPGWKRIWRAYLRTLKNPVPRIDQENASHAKYILANSCFSRETILRAYGLNSFVSYLGIDTELFRPLSLPKEDFVLSVGQCSPHKGFDFIIRSLSLIDEQRRPKLVIVANFTNLGWEDYLVRLAARLRLDLEVKKAIPDTELVSLYNRARLFVYAAILEPFGLAPVEAMACGTPVVAVKEGGVRESVLHNETGILTPRDERAFAEATTGLLADDEQRERMGRRGVEVVRSFWTLQHAGERLEAHLKHAIARSKQNGEWCGHPNGN